MKQCSLERSLHILGPVLGRKRGVDVRIGGHEAMTDGNTIWLPSMPLDDQEAAALGFGLLFHETNHVRYTDFAAKKEPGFVGDMTNCLEDIRIDGLGHKEYPGGKREEELLVQALIARNHAKSCTKDDHPAKILESYVMWRLEHDLLGIDAAEGMAKASEVIFRETFKAGLQTKLDALMFGVRDCRSTAEVKVLAGEIATMLEDEARQEELEQKQQEQMPQAPDGTGQPEQASPQPSPLRQALAAQPDDHATGLGEMAQAAVNETARQTPCSNVPVLSAVDSAEHENSTGGSFAADVKSATNALRHRIAGLLQAETYGRRSLATTGKRLDARQLGKIETGVTRVFVRELAGLKTDTAVQLLADRSGSMSSGNARKGQHALSPIEVARESCFATALALQNVPDVSVAAAAFPGYGAGEIAVLARFQQRVERQAGRFASLDAGGCTPMAEAMLWGASELLGQRKARRILMVTTDGEYDQELGSSMVTRLEAAGIETIGIGIQCKVSHIFRRSREIAAVGELPQAMFELLLDAMKRPAMH